MSAYHLEVFHPGERYPVVVVSFVDYCGGAERGAFAVYRPAYSARGNTRNAVRRVRNDLAGAYALAVKPLGGVK